jgi:hypothetical protein
MPNTADELRRLVDSKDPAAADRLKDLQRSLTSIEQAMMHRLRARRLRLYLRWRVARAIAWCVSTARCCFFSKE